MELIDSLRQIRFRHNVVNGSRTIRRIGMIVLLFSVYFRRRRIQDFRKLAVINRHPGMRLRGERCRFGYHMFSLAVIQ